MELDGPGVGHSEWLLIRIDKNAESLARQELVFKNTILATQQELSREAILVVNGHEKIISYNRNFIDLWGISQSVMDTGSEADALRLAVAQMQEERLRARLES